MMKNWGLLPLLVLAFAIGVLIGSQVMVTFSMTLIVVVLFANWWRKHSLDGVSYKRHWRYRRLFPGEKTSVRISVENQKLLPISWLRVTDSWPLAVGPEDLSVLEPSHIPTDGFLVNFFSLRWYERAQRSFTLLFRKRGIYPIGPALLESGDLFGLAEQKQQLERREKLVVFPEVLPGKELKLDADDPFGDVRSRRRLFEDPNRPMGVREYHPEDEFRRIHWPATARTGDMQVKVYQPVSSQVMVVCLNVSTFPHYWEGVYPDLLEHLIKVTATLVNQGIHDGYAVGLVSNGCFANADQPFRLPPSRSPHQLARIFEALAGVTPFSTAPFEQFLLRSAPGIPYGATLVVVTALTSPMLNEVLFRLKRYRLHMTVISLAKDPPVEIPGVKMIHLPFQG